MPIDLPITEFVVILLASLIGTAATLYFVGRRDARTPPPPEAEDEGISFLFSGTDLVDATRPANILAESDEDASEDPWLAVRKAFEPRFGDLPETPIDAFVSGPERARIYPARAPEDRGRLVFARVGARIRVSLMDEAPMELDRQMAFDASQELRFLRNAISEAPSPIWLMAPDGTVSWQNRAYNRLAEKARSQVGTGEPLFAISLEEDGPGPFRVPMQFGASQDTSWFEVTTRTTCEGRLAYAVNVDAVVCAEQAQRNFVQTLTKTFAHLSTGLAIFDRDQRLVLFNPALIDLTAMPVELLTAKPSLAAFFDYLREKQIMPEPKNYSNWREKIGAVVAAARDGRYSKTWNLPSGLTYRVTGKPHPDGAVAFLIEDISAEISLTRRFRAELETSQAVLDRQDKALAVFSQLGVLNFSNDAFRRIWRFDPDSSFAETTVPDVIKIWRAECAPSPLWDGLQSFVTSFGERKVREADIIHETLGPMNFRAEPLPGGATLISFSQTDVATDRQPQGNALHSGK
ncbi:MULTISPECIES: PAS-domain containing protein [unclassified Marinovum]